MAFNDVLAATRTTESAWRVRQADGAIVMVPASPSSMPSDVVGDVAMVRLRAGRVASYGYQEGPGLRMVETAEQASAPGRADQLADMLIREGDDYVARGDLDLALNRYDRAQVLRAGDPALDYRIATVLDKQLRPVEALIRYQLFLHGLEIERIRAVGEVWANMAEAIAYARERIVVLERQTR
jgi:hypothetical protein